MINRLNNKGQVLFMFVGLLPILILIIGVLVDVSSMVIASLKLDGSNEIAASYYMEHKNDDDVTLKIINLIMKNDDEVANIKIDKGNNTIYLDKKIESIMGRIVGIKEYEVVSEYVILEDRIKRIR